MIELGPSRLDVLQQPNAQMDRNLCTEWPIRNGKRRRGKETGSSWKATDSESSRPIQRPVKPYFSIGQPNPFIIMHSRQTTLCRFFPSKGLTSIQEIDLYGRPGHSTVLRAPRESA